MTASATAPANQMPARVRVVVPCSVADYHVLTWCAGSAGCSVAELVRRTLHVSTEVWRGQSLARAKGVPVPEEEDAVVPPAGQARDRCDVVLDMDTRTVNAIRVRAKCRTEEDLRKALSGEIRWYVEPKRHLMRQHGMMA